MRASERTRRWLRGVLLAAGLAATFAAALVLGLGLHADIAPARRVAGRAVQKALGGLLHGTVEVGPFTSIGLWGARVKDAWLVDEYGRRVITLTGVRAELPPLVVIHDILFGTPPLNFIAKHVRVERARVDFVADPRSGEPTIVRAITPRPSASGPSTGPSTAPRVYLPSIEIGFIALSTELIDVPPLHASLRKVQGELLVDENGLSADVKRFGMVHSGLGADAHGTGTLSARTTGGLLKVTFDGFYGDVEARLNVLLNEGKLEASAEAPAATPVAMKAILPGWPVRETTSARLAVEGRFPMLQTTLGLRARSTSVDVEGPILISHEPSALLTVAVRRFDARLVADGAPETDLSLDGTVIAKTTGGKLRVEAHTRTEPALVEGTVVPAVDASGTWDGEMGNGTVRIAEPGMPVTATFAVTKGGVWDVDATTSNVNLARVPRFVGAGLSGNARGHARIHVEGKEARAVYDADVAPLAASGVSVSRARVTGEASASLTDLKKTRFTAKLRGSKTTVGTLVLDTVNVDAGGDLSGFTVNTVATQKNGPEFRAKGWLALTGRPSLTGAKLSLKRDPVLIEGEIDRLDFESGTTQIRNVRVTGAGGELTGAVRQAEGLLELEAHGENMDLDALSRAFGLPRGALGGKLRLNAEIAVGKDVTRGRIRFGLGNGTIADVGGISLQMSADLQEDVLTGGASGLVAGIGTVGATWNTKLAGRATDLDSYRKMTGTAELQVGHVRLPLVSALFPDDSPITRIGGTAGARILVDRRSADATLPNLFATVSTRELTIELKHGEKKTLIDGIDATLTGALDGTTGDATGTTLLVDAYGDLLTATGAVRLDLKGLLRDPDAGVARIADTPFDMVVNMPPRPLNALPELIRVTDVAGVASGTATVRGTLAHPTLYAKATGSQLVAASADRSRPIDVQADAQYEWDTRAVTGRAMATISGAQVATAVLSGRVPESGPGDTEAQVRVDVSGLPVDLLGAVSGSAIGGYAYGSATFSKRPNEGALVSSLRVVQTTVDRTPLGEARLELDATAPIAKATLHFSGARGALDGEFSGPVSFANVVPELTPAGPIRGKVKANAFSAAVLSPALAGIASRVSGRFDAELALELTPEKSKESLEWIGGVQGTARLSEGTAFVEPLGVDVRNLQFSLAADGKGKRTHVSVRDIGGRVRSATDNLRGSLDLTLEGLTLVSGTADLNANEMPILLQGAPQGRASGHATATLHSEPDAIVVDVDIPKLVLGLPTASTRALIDVRPNRDLTVLQYEKRAHATENYRIWRLVVTFGKNVRIHRNDIDIDVRGTPTVELGGPETQITGSVELTPGGRLPILGKVFTIERGRVEFDTGDPANPRVDVRAVWRAVGDTLVIVQVEGTLQDSKIALRSEPALPQPEVFALLLGGRPGETNDYYVDPRTRSGSGSAGAVALGSGVSALGLNDLIANNPVELRVETTSQNKPRYTAAVQVRENLWFEASTYQRMDYTTGSSTGTNVVSGTVDYRFAEKWSLRGEVGTTGGALDLLWQYRY